MKSLNLTTAKKIITENYTSKGNQPKWILNGRWYKADHMGYEALSEVIVSRILEKSNIDSFVKYEPVMIDYKDEIYRGCASDNFRIKNQEIITLERLHRAYFGIGMAEAIAKQEGVREKIIYTVGFAKKVTGIEEVGKYFSTLLSLDALFLNEDRHTNNIAFLRENGNFQLCPVFDNGLALLSDINDYPFDKDVYENMRRVKAKPFSTDFDEQLDEAERLYGSHLKINLKKAEVYKLFEDLEGFYDEKTLCRARKVILTQMDKYSYFLN